MKKSFLTFVTMVAIAISPCTSYAANSSIPELEVPVNLIAPAAIIDFDISEAIQMSSKIGTTELTVTDLVLTNNAKIGQLELKSLKISPESKWEIKANDSAYFAKQKTDTKEFGLTSESFDFSENGGIKTYEDGTKLASSAESLNISFTGNIGTFTTEQNSVKVATAIPTIGIY